MSRNWDNHNAAAKPSREEQEAARELVAAAQRQRGESDFTADDEAPEARSALIGVPAGPGTRFTPWRVAAVILTGLSLWLIAAAVAAAPNPRPVSGLAVVWGDGPRIPDAAVLAMINRFPDAARLNQPNDFILDHLATHLRAQPGVAEVKQIRLVHIRGPVQAIVRAKGKAPALVNVNGVTRKLEVTLALRQPFLPGVLHDGTRVWLDKEGRVLPGNLPGPGPGRPVVRAIERSGGATLKQVADLWSLIGDQVERGLITDLVCAELLDTPTTGMPAPAQGLVAVLRGGGRILVGRPEEERFGVTLEDKARNLVHTLRCQGDPARIATLNVRFREPAYTLRSTSGGGPIDPGATAPVRPH